MKAHAVWVVVFLLVIPGIARAGEWSEESPDTVDMLRRGSAPPVDLATVQAELDALETSDEPLTASGLGKVLGRISRATLPDEHDNPRAILYARFAAFVNANWKRIDNDFLSGIDPRQRLLMGALGVPWVQPGRGLVGCTETEGTLPILRASYKAQRQGYIGEAIVKLGGVLPIPNDSKLIELVEQVEAREIRYYATRQLVDSLLRGPESWATNATERRAVRAMMQHVLLNADELWVVNEQSFRIGAKDFGRAPLHWLLCVAADALLRIGEPSDAMLLRRVYAHTSDKAAFKSRVADAWGEEGVRYLELPLPAATPASAHEAFDAGQRPLDDERTTRVQRLIEQLAETHSQNEASRILDELNRLVPYGHEPTVRAIIAKAEAEKTYAISDYSSYMQAARIGGNLAFGYCRGVLEEPLPDDYDPDVEHDMTGYRRAEAARALGVFGHPAALPLLDQKQTDPRESPGVRHCCKQAIQRINQLQIIYEIPE